MKEFIYILDIFCRPVALFAARSWGWMIGTFNGNREVEQLYGEACRELEREGY